MSNTFFSYYLNNVVLIVFLLMSFSILTLSGIYSRDMDIRVTGHYGIMKSLLMSEGLPSK